MTFATLEELEKVVEKGEEYPIFWKEEENNILLLGSSSGGGGIGKGNKRGGEDEEPIGSEEESLDSWEEEEDDEVDNMDKWNMEWMTHGPLSLPSVLNNMSWDVAKILMKYDPRKTMKVEDHLDMFYLYMKTIEVHYEDIACILFPCTMDARDVIWYHNLSPNSIENWGVFKQIFLENFVEVRPPQCFWKS